MATKNPFSDIRLKASDSDRSFNWYKDQVRKLRVLNQQRLMSNTASLTTRIMPGKMYMFVYDAKHKDKLPYWDKFPLILPFRKVPGGFYGINLHYMPYFMRFKLLGELHNFATDDKMNEDTRVMISWNILSRLSRVAPINASVKHYLTNHLQSRFLEIPYPDWVTASLLPVENFQGADKEKVWQDSRERR